MKNKSAKEICNAMNYIFSRYKRHPKNLQTDQFKEFHNNVLGKLLKKHNINHYSTFSMLKASIIERFNRTLKKMMWKEFSVKGNYKWIDIINQLVQKYNHTKHRTIQMMPAEVTKKKEKTILKSSYSNMKIINKPKFKDNLYA